MSKLNTTINRIAFSTEVDSIIISRESDEQSVDLLMTVDGISVLDARLDYPSGGSILIDGLALLINRYLNGLSRLQISLDGTVVSDTDLLPDYTDKGIGAAVYVQTHFLNSSSIKQTSIHSPEYLYYYSAIEKTSTLQIDVYYSKDGIILKKTVTTSINLSKGINKIDVSPYNYVNDVNGSISSIIVSLDEIEISYQVIFSDKKPTIILFKNRYKQLESITLFGLVERDFSPTIKTATIGGTRINYDSEGRPVYKVSTGRLASDNYNLIQDFVSGERCWLYAGSYRIEMVVTEVEMKSNDDNYSGTSYTLKFTPANALSKRELTYQDGIFDNTFDTTFN